MKLKTLFLSVISLTFLTAQTVAAQGLFTDSFEEESFDAFFRASRPSAPLPGGSLPGGPGTDVPVGEGILLLVALAGSYVVLKKKQSKEENTL